jgi:flagellar protein FliO/FliZ
MDTALYIRAIIVLLFVLGLALVTLWIVRRFNIVISGGAVFPAGQKMRRLGVIETLPIDARRRLVLIRRDGVEHLILLGLSGESVLETLPARVGDVL